MFWSFHAAEQSWLFWLQCRVYHKHGVSRRTMKWCILCLWFFCLWPSGEPDDLEKNWLQWVSTRRLLIWSERDVKPNDISKYCIAHFVRTASLQKWHQWHRRKNPWLWPAAAVTSCVRLQEEVAQTVTSHALYICVLYGRYRADGMIYSTEWNQYLTQ